VSRAGSIDLQYDQVCGFDELLFNHQAQRKRHVSALIGRRRRTDEHIDPVIAGIEFFGGCLVEIVGCIGCTSLVVNLAICRAVEPVFDEECPFHAWIKNKIIGANGQAHPNAHIFQAVALCGKRRQQSRWFCSRHGYPHRLVRLDLSHSFWYADELLFVLIPGVHGAPKA